MKLLFQKIISSTLIVVLTGMPLIRLAHAADEAATCTQVSQVCVDGPSTKNINGVPVTRDCWKYDFKFLCTDPNAADFCGPLKQNNCVVQGQECLEKNSADVCLRYNHKYSCGIDIRKKYGGVLPEKIEELEPTHLITQKWVSPECDSQLAGQQCTVLSETCTQGPETREINGVNVTRECWKKNVQWQCLGELTNECSAYEADSDCVLKGQNCISELQDGTCQIYDKIYECTIPESTQEVSQCVDRDFAQTMTSMEMLREISRYYDVNSMTFFKGDVSKCSVKLGGALDGVLGGDCCKSQGDPAQFSDWAMYAGTQYAATLGVQSLASAYTYSILTTSAPQFVEATANAVAGVAGALGAGAGTPTLSFMGFGLEVAGGNLVVTFNPASFAAAIAIMALTNWLECETEETVTVFRRDAGLCHKVGSYCHSKTLGVCTTKKTSYCCYISKLSKIINVEGRAQLGRGFGNAENSNCDGFTAQELEQLDFSKMDLSEFYDEIRASMPDTTQMQERVAAQAEQMKGQYENYYSQ